MKIKNKEDLFINKLIEETYSFLPGHESCKDSSDLLLYFNSREKTANEKDLDNFFMSENIKYLHFKLDNKTSCYSASNGPGGKLDIPSNWSVFNKPASNIEISSGNDEDHILKVLNPFSLNGHEIFIIPEGANLYVAFIFEKEKVQLLRFLSDESFTLNLPKAI